MKPRIGMVLGDPGGIGPELIARVLADESLSSQAQILIIGDSFLLRDGEQIAGVQCPVDLVTDVADIRLSDQRPVLLEANTIEQSAVRRSEALAAGGQSVLTALGIALDLHKAGVIDAIMFAPLNKQAMHLTGYGFNDELHWFAHRIGHNGLLGEFNVLDDLWTSRVTSHVGLKEVCELITEQAVVDAIEMVNASLKSAGKPEPRIAVAALNPHAGDGGLFGREELDIIGPAVQRARDNGINADGPWPADTIFLRGRDGECDAVVTMYHDQGQIAMKLMGFELGVTLIGGYDFPVCTPAHGTAYDIAGKGIADLGATREAMRVATQMATARPVTSAERTRLMNESIALPSKSAAA